MRLTLYIGFLLFALPSFGGGFSTWSQVTPGNNEIWYDDGIEKIRINCMDKPNGSHANQVITNIVYWYFKPHYIIGEYDLLDSNNQVTGRAYFIFKEFTCGLQTFNDKTSWTNELKQKHLRAPFWRRSYRTQWGFYNFASMGKFFMLIYFGIPFIIIYIITIIYSAFVFKFRLDNFLTIMNLMIAISLIGLYLLDKWPYSL